MFMKNSGSNLDLPPKRAILIVPPGTSQPESFTTFETPLWSLLSTIPFFNGIVRLLGVRS